MPRRSGASFVAVLAIALVAAAPSPRFGIGDVKFAPAADDVVGVRRSGMLCTPAGKLKWRDLKPGEATLRRAIAEAFATEGTDVKIPSDDDFDNEVRTPYRINLSVIHVAAKTCVPWRGIRVGHQARMRVEGRLVTIWRVFDRQTKALVAKTRICGDIRGDGQSEGADAVRATLVRMTRNLAPALTTGALAENSERSAGCDPREKSLPDDV